MRTFRAENSSEGLSLNPNRLMRFRTVNPGTSRILELLDKLELRTAVYAQSATLFWKAQMRMVFQGPQRSHGGQVRR